MNQEIQQYQSDDAGITLDVRVENDTVWLTQAQIGMLFGVQKAAISKHLKNIFNSGELCQESVVSKMETTAKDGKTYVVSYYNLIEQRLLQNEMGLYAINQKVQSIVQTALPPKQGIFFNGQIFDAYQFVSELIRSAETSIILVDNYADDSVLTQLTKRADGVSATVCVSRLTEAFRLDVERHNRQYPPIDVREVLAVHDRFLLLDGTRLYTFGASFKDLGKKLFCFSLMESEAVVAAVKGMVESP